MPKENPKNSQSKSTFPTNTNTSSNQNDQEPPKDEEQSLAPSGNLSQPEDSSNQTSNSSIVQNNGKINSNPYMNEIADLISAIIKNNLKQGENPKTKNDLFNQIDLDEHYQNMILDEVGFFQRIKPNYMSFQRNINEIMRAILVDWLIDVHHRCNMKKKTLYQCVFIIDAYLSKNIIERINLQLLGVTAFLIACKQNEAIYPTLQNCVDFTANAYTVQELVDMEQLVLQKLDYDVLTPTASEFFEIIADYFEFTEKQRFFGEYFLDASLMDYYLLKYKQSTIAVACGYIVTKFFGLNGSNLILENASPEVKSIEVKECAKYLCYFVENLVNSSLVAAKDKYMSDKYLKVAELIEEN